MSHPEEQLSALVDGELTGAELDRVHAHLAACEPCRAEAAALRDLKRQLRGMPVIQSDDELTRRLLAMAGPGGPVPSRRLRRGKSAPRPAFRPYPGTTPASGVPGPEGTGGGQPPMRCPPSDGGGSTAEHSERTRGFRFRATRPARGMPGRPGGLRRSDSRAPAGGASLRRHGRYIVLGAVSIAVTVGIGAAAFTMGGGTGSPGPRITPQLEMFSVEHASNNGQVPLVDPSPTASGKPYQVSSIPPP